MSEEKRKAVYEAAFKLAAEIGAVNITKVVLCAAAGISPGSFQHITGQTFLELCDTLPADVPGTAITKKRVSPKHRKHSILEYAVKVAATEGYQNVTRERLARDAGVSMGLVSKYFGTMRNLRRAVMRHAVTSENATVVAQGLVVGDPHARKASKELKAKAAKIITG